MKLAAQLVGWKDGLLAVPMASELVGGLVVMMVDEWELKWAGGTAGYWESLKAVSTVDSMVGEWAGSWDIAKADQLACSSAILSVERTAHGWDGG